MRFRKAFNKINTTGIAFETTMVNYASIISYHGYSLNQATNRNMKTLSFILMAYLLVQFYPVWSQTDPVVRQKQYNLEKGLAIRGYDPVAYFTQKKAVKGSATNTYTYKNVTYQFASPANLEVFRKSPEKYEPQYGGWCAYAMGASGEKVEIDPETFKVKDGKLYLFYHSFINNTLPKWNSNKANLHKKADANWSKFE